MNTDWKALCAELADVLAEEYGVQREFDSGDPLLGSGAIELLSRVRAALDQPEPQGLTDEEILNLSQEHQVSCTMCDGGVIYPLQAGADMKDDVLSFARALITADRARWGRPAVEPVPDTKARELLNLLLDDLDALIDSSEGVAGLHLNGDIACWESLRQGGRFETWLMRMDEARTFLDSTMDRPAVEPETNG